MVDLPLSFESRTVFAYFINLKSEADHTGPEQQALSYIYLDECVQYVD